MFFSCSSNSKYDKMAMDEVEYQSNEASQESVSESMAPTAAAPTNFIASAAASDINDDEDHKFIRTAQLKFKVKAIPEATYKIENITIRNKGFIIRSAINNEQSYSTTTVISKDSAMVTHYYNLVADMRLKVPKENLDTVLKEIAPLAVEINYRTVDAQDVTLQILSDKLKKERINKKQKRVSDAIDNKGRKLDDIMDAENLLDKTLEEADNTILAAYSLNEQIAYSTIDVKMHQSQTMYTEKILQEKSITKYEPGFGLRAKDALSSGWNFICELVIIILHIWPVLFIALGIAIFVYFIRKKRKNKD